MPMIKSMLRRHVDRIFLRTQQQRCFSSVIICSGSSRTRSLSSIQQQQQHPSLCTHLLCKRERNSWTSSSSSSSTFSIQHAALLSNTSPFTTRYMSSINKGNKANQTPPLTIKKPRKVTIISIAAKKRRDEKITMVTAYDYPSAIHVDRAGMDIVLVGDSCAMVELGFETTQVRIIY